MGIGVFGFIWFVLLTVVCVVPFGIAVSYFILGIKSVYIGRKENSRLKTIGGYNGIFISLVSMVAIFFLWRWLWEI